MKKTIQREAYMAWLAQFRDKPLIKVLTGMRRVGKSTERPVENGGGAT